MAVGGGWGGSGGEVGGGWVGVFTGNTTSRTVYQSEKAEELEAHLNKGPDVPTNELTD